MLCDVLLAYDNKIFTVGKSKVMIFTAGKKRGRWGGGTQHFGGIPQ